MSISTDNYNERSDTMAIQNRRGLMADFDPNKLLPGEFAFPLDTGEVYYCVAPGNVKRVVTEEELQEILTSSPEAYTALKQLLSDLEDDPSELTNILTNISNLQSGKLDKTGDSKYNTVTFTEAEEDENIESGEPHYTLFGKILKSIKTLRNSLTGKFDKANVVQSAEIDDEDKVASAAVTNGLAQSVSELNDNLTSTNNKINNAGITGYERILRPTDTYMSIPSDYSIGTHVEIIWGTLFVNTILADIDKFMIVTTQRVWADNSIPIMQTAIQPATGKRYYRYSISLTEWSSFVLLD